MIAYVEPIPTIKKQSPSSANYSGSYLFSFVVVPDGPAERAGPQFVLAAALLQVDRLDRTGDLHDFRDGDLSGFRGGDHAPGFVLRDGRGRPRGRRGPRGKVSSLEAGPDVRNLEQPIRNSGVARSSNQGCSLEVDLKVRDPKQLKLVKVGDQVRAVYTEALALSVEPAMKK